jgi:hypothetical protein
MPYEEFTLLNVFIAEMNQTNGTRERRVEKK